MDPGRTGRFDRIIQTQRVVTVLRRRQQRGSTARRAEAFLGHGGERRCQRFEQLQVG